MRLLSLLELLLSLVLREERLGRGRDERREFGARERHRGETVRLLLLLLFFFFSRGKRRSRQLRENGLADLY